MDLIGGHRSSNLKSCQMMQAYRNPCPTTLLADCRHPLQIIPLHQVCFVLKFFRESAFKMRVELASFQTIVYIVNLLRHFVVSFHLNFDINNSIEYT